MTLRYKEDESEHDFVVKIEMEDKKVGINFVNIYQRNKYYFSYNNKVSKPLTFVFHFEIHWNNKYDDIMIYCEHVKEFIYFCKIHKYIYSNGIYLKDVFLQSSMNNQVSRNCLSGKLILKVIHYVK